jgi:antitoxin (DNA-binding transcriptional repressor) of toxin-antitoxin stability system
MAVKPVIRIGLDEGRSTLPRLAALAHTGQASLLTRHGKPFAAIVAPEVLLASRPRPDFLALRGSGRGLWGPAASAAVADLRDEWEDRAS